ncbi:uncharacterized protein LOC122307217 [Carya illinoinensis]|uniref:uncharacterized protein LOC122307217 n=1 Tax=Carya illinoinensis TaxID=32201 RepID=UPI001C724400|nr:uncharacterized protein LOC122307217 [Carya illinoinensis]
MDAYSGYNQICMNPDDEEKTSFVTDRGLYCYSTMPIGLKNAGATYQWLVNCVFKGLIGRNMEVYVDDLLVKSGAPEQHLADLCKALVVLRQYQMKLNPVTVDYFTKWVEVEALATITASNITRFLWRTVTCRFEISSYWTTKGSLNLTTIGSSVGTWESNFSTHLHDIHSPTGKSKQPMILKKKLNDKKWAWAEELVGVLWAYLITVRTPMGETPFTLSPMNMRQCHPSRLGSLPIWCNTLSKAPTMSD